VTSEAYAHELRAVGQAHGLHHLGFTDAEPLLDARRALEERKAAGLAAGMQFTYRNPVRSTSPQDALPGARSLVVAALAHPAEVPAPPGAGPWARVGRYATADHYGALRHGLGAVADRLRADGWRARVLADDNALVDRAAAHRAGLGWYGKSANLLLPGEGSWFVLGSVLTDAVLPPAPEPVADGCGPCRRCLDGCPTGAIVAPGVVDARRCLAWLVQAEGDFPVELRGALGDRIYGCDDCQEVCPPNRRAQRDGHDRGLTPTDPAQAWIGLVELLELPDDELLARHGRWYVPRRDPRYLRRNALVALGNVGDAADERVRAVLARHLQSGDELLAEHAAWAWARLGLPPRAPVDDDLAPLGRGA
jgi:epoxyqueuosine reductase